ncbi:hypothetical protein IE077_001365, partial [Cardiosporidium cionae]
FFFLQCSVAINCISLSSGDLCEALRTKELQQAFKSALAKHPDKRASDKEAHARLTKTYNALISADDPFDAFADSERTFDLDLTSWNLDPYPNGVQDLPAPLKEILRKGGKLKAYLGDKDKDDLKWRSSQDLSFLEWCYGDSEDYTNKVAVVKLRNVSKGLTHPALQKANQKDPRKVTSKVCVTLFGPAVEDFPEGVEIPLRAKSQKERDVFVEQIVQWRDAASYNF